MGLTIVGCPVALDSQGASITVTLCEFVDNAIAVSATMGSVYLSQNNFSATYDRGARRRVELRERWGRERMMINFPPSSPLGGASKAAAVIVQDADIASIGQNNFANINSSSETYPAAAIVLNNVTGILYVVCPSLSLPPLFFVYAMRFCSHLILGCSLTPLLTAKLPRL
jgi:hypothetical protein